MPRTSLRDRLQNNSQQVTQGREALYAPLPVTSGNRHADSDDKPLTVDGIRSTQDDQRWEDSHLRVTFYCPVPVLRSIEETMNVTSRSKSQVIVDALRRDLVDRGVPRD